MNIRANNAPKVIIKNEKQPSPKEEHSVPFLWLNVSKTKYKLLWVFKSLMPLDMDSTRNWWYADFLLVTQN